VEREWDDAAEWEWKLDADPDGRGGGNAELNAGDGDGERRWSDSDQDADATGSAGTWTHAGAELCRVIDDAHGYGTDHRKRDTCWRAEADWSRHRSKRVASRGNGVDWTGKPVERGGIYGAHVADRQFDCKSRQLECKRGSFDWCEWEPERRDGVYGFADIRTNPQMNKRVLH